MNRPARGFTLLELIVVLAIFGVFAAMAYGGLNYVLTARRELESRLDRTAEWQKAFQRLRNDFQLAATRGARDGLGYCQPAVSYTDYEQRVELTRGGWPNPLSLQRASLERIAYRLDESKHQLLRDTWRLLDRGDDREPVSLVLLSGVDEVAWRFFDGKDWKDKWPATPPPPSPNCTTLPPTAAPLVGVELTLRSKDYTEVRWVFRLPAIKP